MKSSQKQHHVNLLSVALDSGLAHFIVLFSFNSHNDFVMFGKAHQEMKKSLKHMKHHRDCQLISH